MIREVVPGVHVATAELYTTTTTIVAGAGGGCLLVDPAVSVADLAALARWLPGHGLRPVAGWSTHPHWDHLLWSAALGDVPRYATPRAVAVAAREQAGLLRDVQESAPGHDLTLFGTVEAMVGHEIDWPGPRALVYEHHAHAPGHGAVFLPDSGVLVAGDMLSDLEIPLLDLESADPFGGYRDGLGMLAGIPGVRVVVPGHGHVGGEAEFRRRLAVDYAYLNAVQTGGDIADPRLTEDWLRAEHARHRARAASPGNTADHWRGPGPANDPRLGSGP
ncbi:MAG TPA: MBL fold metallo-hydrolase [Trebonia sp.]|jgi:glyoxylase-like metal-dependent hydrolase (beta-lactamase superfamily II)